MAIEAVAAPAVADDDNTCEVIDASVSVATPVKVTNTRVRARPQAWGGTRREEGTRRPAPNITRRPAPNIPRFVQETPTTPFEGAGPKAAPPKAAPFDQFARSIYKSRARAAGNHCAQFPSLPSRAYEVQPPKKESPKPTGVAAWSKLKATQSMQSTVRALRPGSARFTVVNRIVSGDPTYGGDYRGDKW